MAGGVHGRAACMVGAMCGRGECMAGGMCGRGGLCVAGGMRGKGGHAWHGVCARGMCGRGHAWQGACVTGKTAIAAGSTHPTGMHSCFGMRWIISSQNISCE